MSEKKAEEVGEGGATKERKKEGSSSGLKLRMERSRKGEELNLARIGGKKKRLGDRNVKKDKKRTDVRGDAYQKKTSGLSVKREQTHYQRSWRDATTYSKEKGSARAKKYNKVKKRLKSGRGKKEGSKID